MSLGFVCFATLSAFILLSIGIQVLLTGYSTLIIAPRA